ncbi:rolling circle replication-associated protein, partial [Benzoatithermus flavus]
LEKWQQEEYKKQLEQLRKIAQQEEYMYRTLKERNPRYIQEINKSLEIAGFHICLAEYEKPIIRGFVRDATSVQEGVKNRLESLKLREELQKELDDFSKRHPFVSKDDKEAIAELEKIKEKYKDELVIREDNERRKIKKLKLLVQSNFDEWTHFITLTHHYNQLNIKKAKQNFKEWAKEVNKIVDDFKYVYVMEFQTRGAIHFHVICKCADEKGVLDKKRFMKVRQAWKHGMINIKGIKYQYVPKENKKEAQEELKQLAADEQLVTIWSLGNYLTSYLKKQSDNMLLFGSAMYGFSKNLKKEIKITDEKKIAQLLEMLGVEQLKEKTYEIYQAETDNNIKLTFWNKLIENQSNE